MALVLVRLRSGLGPNLFPFFLSSSSLQFFSLSFVPTCYPSSLPSSLFCLRPLSCLLLSGFPAPRYAPSLFTLPSSPLLSHRHLPSPSWSLFFSPIPFLLVTFQPRGLSRRKTPVCGPSIFHICAARAGEQPAAQDHDSESTTRGRGSGGASAATPTLAGVRESNDRRRMVAE